jgi:hypothetical protein
MARLVDVGQEANGIIAIGQVATGVVAIGQVATGVIAIGQVARGGIAIGMGAIGVVAIGMGAVGLFGVIGMMAAGARGGGLLFIPLVPRLDGGASPPSYRRTTWWLIGVAQCAALTGVAVAFWLLAGIPVGDLLFGPGGVLR